MDGHGCRHVTWAGSPSVSLGFFHPMWTTTFSRCYGRPTYQQYTIAMDAKMNTPIPGMLAAHWDSLAVNSVLNSTTEEETMRARTMMQSVHNAPGPVLVRQDGTLDYNASSIMSANPASLTFMSTHVQERITTNAEDGSLNDTSSSVVHDDSQVCEDGCQSSQGAYVEFTKYCGRLADYVQADPSMYATIIAGLSSLEDTCHSEVLAKGINVASTNAATVSFNPVLNTLFDTIPRGGIR